MPVYTPLLIPMTVSVNAVSLPVSVGANLTVNTDPEYEGEFEFTPGDEAQIIPVGGYRVSQDITINPIPSNYGKITWNGAVMTVS